MPRFPILLATLALFVSTAQAADAIRVACVGDSITQGSGYPAALGKLLGADYEVKNFGVSGATLLRAGDKPYVQQGKWTEAKEFQPDIVLLMLGTNDTKPKNYAHIANAAADLGAMIDELNALASQPRIILCKPVPVIGAGNFGIDNMRLNEGVLPVIHQVATERKLPIVDMNAALQGKDEMFKDRVHPRGAQDLMAKSALEEVQRAQPAAAAK